MLINGEMPKDNRGSVSFVNDFDFKDVKRFYLVENADAHGARGWHGHKKEGKYVFVPEGRATIGVVNMETEKTQWYTLDAKNPQVLYIPPGNYNAARSLRKGTKIMYFSTATLEESLADDFREPLEKWVV